MLSSIAMTTSSPMSPPRNAATDIFESSDELILSPKLSPDSKSPTTRKSAHARQWVNTISNRLASSLNLSSSWTSSSNANSNKWPLASPINRSLSGQSSDLLKICPEDIASQLTLIDLPIFQKITKDELTSIAWNTPKKHTLAPNIVKFTKRFNQVSFWVVEQVLQSPSQFLNCFSQSRSSFAYNPLSSNLFASVQSRKEIEKSNILHRNFIRRLSRNSSYTSLSYQSTLELDAKARSELLSYFITVAKKLFDLNNLHSSYAIVCALSSTPIYRLSKTWSYLGKKDKATFDKLSAFFSDDSNFEAMRRHLDESPLPCIPYLGMYLRDLVYIDIANPKKVKIQTDAKNVTKLRVTRTFASQFEQQVPTKVYEKIHGKSKPIQINGQVGSGKVTSNGSSDHQMPIVTTTRDARFQSIISQVQNFQQSTYSDLSVIPEIRDYLMSARYIEELQKFLEEDNYKLSLKLEPNVPICNVSNGSEIRKQPKNQSKFYISHDDEPVEVFNNGLNVPKQYQPSNSMPGAYDTANRPTCFKSGHRRAHSLDTGPLLLAPVIDGADIDVDRRVSVDPSTVLESGPVMRPEIDDGNSDWMMVDNIKKSLIDDSIIGETSFRNSDSRNPFLGPSIGNQPEVKTRKSSFDGFLNSAFVRSPNSKCPNSEFYVDTCSSYPKRIEPQLPMLNGNHGNGTQWPSDCHCTKSCKCTNNCGCIKTGSCEGSGNCPSGGDCGSSLDSDDGVQFRGRSSAMSKAIPTFSGVMKRRILVKEGKKCACSVWIPYYVELKGCLMIYYPKVSLGACAELDKSHFNMNQCKKLSLIGGWTVDKNVSANEASELSPSLKFTLSDPNGKNVYEFMVDDANEYEIWITKLKSLSSRPSGLYRGPAKNLRTPALSTVNYSTANRQGIKF